MEYGAIDLHATAKLDSHRDGGGDGGPRADDPDAGGQNSARCLVIGPGCGC